MITNNEMPRERRGGEATASAKPQNGPPPSANTGAECAAGRAEREPKSALPAPGRTNTASDGGSERAAERTQPRRWSPARTNLAREGDGRHDHTEHEPQPPAVVASTNPARKGRSRRSRHLTETQVAHAAAATDPGASPGDLAGPADDGTHHHCAGQIAVIRSLWRRRQSWHRAEKSLSLAVHAVCRQHIGSQDPGLKLSTLKTKAAELRGRIESAKTSPGDDDAAVSAVPLLVARDVLEQNRKAVEKELTRLVKALPIAPWALAVPGIGPGSLMAIVGEAGDVGSYRSVSAFWKRMGLAVIGGERQRRKAGADGIEHGFSPERGAVSFNVGSALVGGMGHGPRLRVGEDPAGRNDLSDYQKLFVERCRYLAARDPDEHARPPTEKDGVSRESFSSHCANSARRYVTKRFFRSLYSEWKRLAGQFACETHRGAAGEPTHSSTSED